MSLKFGYVIAGFLLGFTVSNSVIADNVFKEDPEVWAYTIGSDNAKQFLIQLDSIGVLRGAKFDKEVVLSGIRDGLEGASRLNVDEVNTTIVNLNDVIIENVESLRLRQYRYASFIGTANYCGMDTMFQLNAIYKWMRSDFVRQGGIGLEEFNQVITKSRMNGEILGMFTCATFKPKFDSMLFPIFY
ncbi:hypothetical protein [Vibrio mexicanus]|uniref:hypothetical protein n=1 Tax=Vibrio mexicanus TaxID=1004326 RepID=UPI00063CD0E9|nr:hypothetical protein [Vibrio mexicanus]